MKNTKRSPKGIGRSPASVQLPKNALSRVDLGQAFAEYDLIRDQPFAFVKTPAVTAAETIGTSKCFFVGRRGTGKTAINYFVLRNNPRARLLIPQVFDLIRLPSESDRFTDTRQQPFRSLVLCFQRAIADEIIGLWIKHGSFSFRNSYPAILRERNFIEDYDFDQRMLEFVEEILGALSSDNRKEWHRIAKRAKAVAEEMSNAGVDAALDYTILIDRIDDAWSGTDEAVVLLMALMHACVQMQSSGFCARLLLFLRENIFERVRQLDNEFARLETAVVPLDWTHEQLRELVERRLNLPFNTKLPLGGETWAYFFDGDQATSEDMVLGFCQHRPRDVLTYCSFAVAASQSHQHTKIQMDDLIEARRRFSDSRLKDLGDEYSENYPNIGQLLRRFYGLGRRFTVTGIEAFIKKLLFDDEVKQHCAKWIYLHTTPELIITLLYNIGFLGIESREQPLFRSLGPKTTTPPPITPETVVSVHPSYWDALNLQEDVVVALPEDRPLQVSGMLNELPNGATLEGYQSRLAQIKEDLSTLPSGRDHASRFEDLVGELIRLCFFRSLANVQARQRDVNGVVIRDWIAANRASDGFWRMIRERYDATQIVWECKNFFELDADAFQQVSYYMTKEIGRFAIIAFRGQDTKPQYFKHIQRIAGEKEGGLVLLVTERDMNVFLRQAINGKVREEHIYELYDRTVREIS